jgi:hypothetical protein
MQTWHYFPLSSDQIAGFRLAGHFFFVRTGFAIVLAVTLRIRSPS